MHSDFLPVTPPPLNRPPLSITTAPDGEPGAVRLAAHGELETRTAHLLHDAVLEALRRHRPGHITVDLTGITFFDVRGVRALLTGRTDATQANCRFTVADASHLVTRMLGVVGLLETFGLVERPAVPAPRPPRRRDA